jgi:V8-like Glu-specific endopeptidase
MSPRDALLEDNMIRLGPDFDDKLLDVLLGLPALNDQANRSFLLRHLPEGPVTTIERYNAKLADLHKIIEAAAAMGQLTDSGEWALTIVTRNALKLARGTEPGRQLEVLLGELETQQTKTPLPPIQEVIIGPDERLPISFLERGLLASRSVAKLLVPQVIGGRRQQAFVGSGTGWVIAPGLLITNYHVIEVRGVEGGPPATDADITAQATLASAWFNFIEPDRAHHEYACTGLVHYNRLLDYALLRVAPESASRPGKPLTEWGHLSVLPQPPALAKGGRLNIVQHPLGGPQRIAIRSNFYYDNFSTAAQPDRIRYLTDTEPGASGSPVFDDGWQVVALHHAAVRVPESQYKGEVVKYNNQGILIHAILASLPEPIRQEIHAAQGWT